VTMANAPHLAVRRTQYAADLGEKGSKIFLIIRNCWLDTTSENRKVICPSCGQKAIQVRSETFPTPSFVCKMARAKDRRWPGSISK
jgi:hypothetical protein